MGWSCDSSMDSVCWVLAIVVVAVLIYLGCSELRKTSPSYASARRAVSARASAKADDAADGPAHGAKPEARRELKGMSVHDAFEPQVGVDPSMTRVVPKDAYAVPESVFLQDFVDGDATTFRPINKEEALKSANTRPAQHMQNGRDQGTKSRTVGLSPMEFARKTIPRPQTSSSCVAFNDTDTRQTMVNESTNCFATESCPWDK